MIKCEFLDLLDVEGSAEFVHIANVHKDADIRELGDDVRKGPAKQTYSDEKVYGWMVGLYRRVKPLE